MSKILITGATGKTGMAALRELISRGADVRAMTRNPEKASTFEERGIPAAVADFHNATSLNKALEGVDRMYLVSAPTQDMVQTEKNVINAAKKAGVEFVVKISALGSHKESPFQLGQAHKAIEEYLQKSDLAHAILQPHGFMQNLIGSAASIQAQGMIYANAGDIGYPFIDARDIGSAAAQLLMEGPEEHDGQSYVLTGPKALTYAEMADILAELLQRPVQHVPISDEAARDGMVQAGFPQWLAEDLVRLNQLWRSNPDLYCTTTPLVGELTGHPPRSFRTFVREHLQLFSTA
ncbi:MAG: SDR family oxidoreductase [Bacteroidota bacterium]